MELVCKKCGVIDTPEIKENGPHNTAFCKSCGEYIQHVSQPKTDFTFYFGKYKGRAVSSMLEDKAEINYLKWAYENMTTLKDWQREIINNLL